jgi:DNA-binding IclR family transcriptional regulator
MADNRMRGKNGQTPFSQSLEKGLRVLSCFDVTRPQWSFTEICTETGFAKATAFRLLRTLETLDYLDFDEVTSKYHLGPSMLRSAHLALSHGELVWAAHPLVSRLAEETTETVNLAVWTSRSALIVDAVLTSRPFKPYNPVGLLISSIATVDVKLFMAFGPYEKRELVSDGDLERSTEQTLVLDEERARELDRVKAEGIAYDLDDWIVGMSAVGVPVFDASGEIRAAIGVVAPSERFGPAERQKHAEATLRAAHELSEKLGYRGATHPATA